MKLQVIIDGHAHEVESPPADRTRTQRKLIIDGKSHEVDIVRVEPNLYSVLINGQSIEVTTSDDDYVWVDTERLTASQRDPRQWTQGQSSDSEHGTVTIKAAMPGKVVEVLVELGEMIETGQGLLVVEAMKMQNEVKAPKSGAVQAIRVEAGDSVSAGQALIVVE